MRSLGLGRGREERGVDLRVEMGEGRGGGVVGGGRDGLWTTCSVPQIPRRGIRRCRSLIALIFIFHFPCSAILDLGPRKRRLVWGCLGMHIRRRAKEIVKSHVEGGFGSLRPAWLLGFVVGSEIVIVGFGLRMLGV
jgi:hypothetical protein